jgi:biopolymer transport protein ExbB
MFALIKVTGWASNVVLLLLVCLSVWSIAIVLDRRRAFKTLSNEPLLPSLKPMIENRDWKTLLKTLESKTARPGLVFETVLLTLKIAPEGASSVDRAVKSLLTERKMHLEKGFTVLATLGSNAPFVGLFGTVLGIIQAFGVLAQTNSGTGTVMASLAEALIATAIGLFVAIPAVVAYNYFARVLKLNLAECDAVKDLVLSYFHKSESKA